ncbi:MAG: dihydropteroate synthase [Muribaculaceae bacterium]|nr:dihydropteroate synthase [Muribaculaceae bacterium]
MIPFSFNIHGRLVEFDQPAVMGIINVTDDSFYDGSRAITKAEIAAKAAEMLEQGTDIIDIGACSTRPGSSPVSKDVELERLEKAIAAVRDAVGDKAILSVDTFRAEVAKKAVAEWGADMVNDISGGTLDNDMFSTVATLKCPYVLMHMRGTPETMQSNTAYDNVTVDVIKELSFRVSRLRDIGVADIIVDPGFGFSKTLEQNYELLCNIEAFKILECPILVGVSRKSMITRLLDIKAEEAAIPTAILGAYALEHGTSILRVHDVALASQTVKLLNAINHDMICSQSV